MFKQLRYWYPVSSLQGNKGEKKEGVTDFIFLGSKITVDADFSHEIKTHFLPERKAMENLDSALKTRDIILPAKVHIVKSMGFPCGSAGIESSSNAGDLSLIPRLGRSPGEGKG